MEDVEEDLEEEALAAAQHGAHGGDGATLASASSSPAAALADASQAIASTLFGPRASGVVEMERRLTSNEFGLFALSGAFGCSLTHSLLIPLDVVKTRMQTAPGR